MQDFRKVKAWQANRELTVMVYRLSGSWPREERYGLTAQARSAVVSIGANIAEGCGRATNDDTKRFFQIAFASGVELLHHLITALDLGFLKQADFNALEVKLESVRRMTGGFIKVLRANNAP
jgi:four helix bundle protein